MLMGDVRWGTALNRYFLERNDQGELQGAVFVFTGGLEAGAFRLLWGPDSMLYVGMIGGRDDADGYPLNLETRVDYGLQKLRYTGEDSTFEMLAIRSGPQGFEIEFTRPVDSSAARNPANYTIQSYHMTPSSGYGSGSKQGLTTLVPSAIQLSPDRRKVYLVLGGLVPSAPGKMRVVYFKLANGLKSAAGGSLWANEAWYTLNAFGTGTPFEPPVALGAPAGNPLASGAIHWSLREGMLTVRVPEDKELRVRLRGLRGELLANLPKTGSGEYALSLRGLPKGFVILEATRAAPGFRRLIELP
jgi:hypothetical protein